MRFAPFVSVASLALVAATFGFGFSAGCSDDTVDGTQPSGSGAGTGTNTGAGGAGAGGAGMGGAGGATSTGTYTTGVGGAPTVIAECQNQVYQCGDLMDNDGDGLIDYQDPDCLGPCDNTEDSYYGGIPGQAGPACQVDCYFDSNSGAGNDECYWTHECDPNSTNPNYYPEPANGAQCAYDPNATYPGSGQNCAEMEASQTQVCYDFCGPLTPNGCDCFGCCVFPQVPYPVWLGSEGADGNSVCTMADITDPTKCHPCEQVDACLNDCGPCEVCIGKPQPDPGCNPGTGGGGQGGSGGGTTGGQCETGVQPCGLAGQDPCGADFYCITGCCRPVPQ